MAGEGKTGIVWGISKIGAQHKRKTEFYVADEAQERKDFRCQSQQSPNSPNPQQPAIYSVGCDTWWLMCGDRLRDVFPSVWERRHFGDC